MESPQKQHSPQCQHECDHELIASTCAINPSTCSPNVVPSEAALRADALPRLLCGWLLIANRGQMVSSPLLSSCPHLVHSSFTNSFNYPFRVCHLILNGTVFTTNALEVSKKSINKLGFGYRVFIRSGCSSLVSFVVAPAGTHGITVSEHLTFQSNCYMSSCFVCTCVDGLSLNLSLSRCLASKSQDPSNTASCWSTNIYHLALPLRGMGSELRFSSFCGKYLQLRSLPRSPHINYY